MKETVVIVGGAGGAKVAYDIYSSMRDFRPSFERGFIEFEIRFVNCFIPEDDPVFGKLVAANPLDDSLSTLKDPEMHYFVATGDNKLRREITNQLRELTGRRPVRAIHNSAIISQFCDIRWGVLLCANAVVNPSASVGHGAIVNTGAVVEHDCKVGDYAQISPNTVLCGYVTVGGMAYVYSGAIVLPHVTIGAGAVVAAGSVVKDDVPPGALVAGNPAKIVKEAYARA